MQTPFTHPLNAGANAGSFSRVDSLFDDLRETELSTPKPPRRIGAQQSKDFAESSPTQPSDRLQQHRHPPCVPDKSEIRKQRTELLAIKRSIGLALETLPASMQNTRKDLMSKLSWVKIRLNITENALQRGHSLGDGILLPPVDRPFAYPDITGSDNGLASSLRHETARVNQKDLVTLEKLDARLTQAIPIAKRIEGSLSDRFKLPPVKP